MSLQKNIIDMLSRLNDTGVVIKAVNWHTGEIVCGPEKLDPPAITAVFDPRIMGDSRRFGLLSREAQVSNCIHGPLTMDEYEVCTSNLGEPGAKIMAIKYIRARREIGLAEAKRLAESNFDFPIPKY